MGWSEQIVGCWVGNIADCGLVREQIVGGLVIDKIVGCQPVWVIKAITRSAPFWTISLFLSLFLRGPGHLTNPTSGDPAHDPVSLSAGRIGPPCSVTKISFRSTPSHILVASKRTLLYVHVVKCDA